MTESATTMTTLLQSVCDYCTDSTALLYCRADLAKLCFSCDRQVHSTNQLFSKHTRSILCDACNSSPASILCETEHSVLCQNCDWEWHKAVKNEIHNRRPIEGFNGCPSVNEFLSILGFVDLDKKGLLEGDDLDLDEFSDFLVWETPSIGNFDDMIFPSDSSHSLQAIGVPPLPKNRNNACGQHKDEILRQLREMAKLEPELNSENLDDARNIRSRELVPDLKPGNISRCCDYDANSILFPAYEVAGSLCCYSDNGEGANNIFHPSAGHVEEGSLVPDKHSDMSGSVSHAKLEQEGPSQTLQNHISSRTSAFLPKIAPHEFTSKDRDSAISRYKEKKKTRRYDGQIRYESRKARAESRTRIKGRFAKIDKSSTGTNRELDN